METRSRKRLDPIAFAKAMLKKYPTVLGHLAAAEREEKTSRADENQTNLTSDKP
jgi:hypothetical protein